MIEKSLGREIYKTRSLGLDIGDRWIGVALSDPSGVLASPLTIIDRRDDLVALEAITGIISQRDVGRVIVGLPRSMDGSLGQQAEKVTAFTQLLRRHTSVPVEFRDERLSTVSAKRLMSYAKKARRKQRDDAVAAALILQGFLDEGDSGELY
ncbi:MAG: Holliday junction resolvase RuvX [Dehalococcoidales bacterium]